jgi:hypothetical protein
MEKCFIKLIFWDFQKDISEPIGIKKIGGVK